MKKIYIYRVLKKGIHGFAQISDPEFAEAVTKWYSVKTVFLDISQNSKENICVRACMKKIVLSQQIKKSENPKISKA